MQIERKRAILANKPRTWRIARLGETRTSQTRPVLRAFCEGASGTLIRHRGFMRV